MRLLKNEVGICFRCFVLILLWTPVFTHAASTQTTPEIDVVKSLGRAKASSWEIRGMMNALENADLGALDNALKFGTDPNGRDERGYTPLIWAVRDRKEQAVSTLLASGADPNRRNGDNRTALFYAYATDENLSNIITSLIFAGARTDEYQSWFIDLDKNNPNRIAFDKAKELAVKDTKPK